MERRPPIVIVRLALRYPAPLKKPVRQSECRSCRCSIMDPANRRHSRFTMQHLLCPACAETEWDG